jgi:hypothetical protein
MFRKPAARAILLAAKIFTVGLAVEVHFDRPRLARAPFTGAAILAGACVIQWARNQLAGEPADAPAA